MHMMIQRDSLTENMILQGRYEVRKATHTTQVERDYEVYDREEKKEYRVKEFYPSNYCSRGADGQTVIVRGVRNQSVFEQSKEWFAQAYRQIAAGTKTKGFPEAVRLFSENNTIYVILEKSDGGRLSEQIRHAGGKLSYAESVPILRAIVETLLQMQPPKGYLPQISKESIVLLKKQNKTEVIFTDIVQKEDVIYSVGSLWTEMLTGLCPQTSSLRAPSELGVELPAEAEQMILRCLEKNTENRVSLEELLSILPRGRKERIVLTKKQVLLAVTALIFAIAAWKSLLPKEKEVLVAEKQSFLTETADVERGVSSPVSPGAIQVSVASAPAITEEAVSRVVLEEIPINTPEQTPGKTKKTKQKRNKKNKKKSGEERQNKVEQSIVVQSKPHKPKSNLFDFW